MDANVGQAFDAPTPDADVQMDGAATVDVDVPVADINENHVALGQEDPAAQETDMPVEAEAAGNEQPESPEQPEQTEQPQSNALDAAFAAMRRAMLRQHEESPEVQLAKRLSEIYGADPETILKWIDEFEQYQQAQQMNVPPEIVQKLTQMEQENNELKFQFWQARMLQEEKELRQKYPYAKEEHIAKALEFIKETGSLDLPLEQAFIAANYQDLAEMIAQQVRQQVLAEMSGRNKRTLPNVQGAGTPSIKKDAWSLSDEEFDKIIEQVKRSG